MLIDKELCHCMVCITVNVMLYTLLNAYQSPIIYELFVVLYYTALKCSALRSTATHSAVCSLMITKPKL